jgi:hypothetical protein
MNDGTGVRRRWWRRASTVLILVISAAVAAAVPALAHPVFSNDPPGFPNPQGSTASPYAAGSRPTLNLVVPFEQDGVIFNGAVNTTVDIKVTVPGGWSNPACGAASTAAVNRQVGSAVPGWTCMLETVSGHQRLHWHGPQVSREQSEDASAQFFTFLVTVPSPATQTSYGATGGPEGFYVEQAYANGTLSLWRTPNGTRPGEVANGIVRTVAGTAAPTPSPKPAPTPAPTAPPPQQGGGAPASSPSGGPLPTGTSAAVNPPSATAQDLPAPASTDPPPGAQAQAPSVEQLTQQRDDAPARGVRWQVLTGVVLGVVVVVGAVLAVVRRRRSSS